MKHWQEPRYQIKRFGFEVTMYCYVDSNLHQNQRSTLTKAPAQKVGALASLLSITVLVLIGLTGSDTYAGQSEWLSSNGNLENTRFSQDTMISPQNVKHLGVKWQYKTEDDKAPNQPSLGSVAITPAVEGDYIYFTDFGGNVYKNDRHDGHNIWKKNLFYDYSSPGKVISESRNTPLILGKLLIIGSTFFLNDPLCAVIEKQTNAPAPNPAPLVCHSGDGAIVIAINKYTGKLVWSTKVSDHPATKITGSASGFDNTVIVGVSSWEEDWARSYPYVQKLLSGKFKIDLTQPYPCCSVSGAVVRLNATDGKIIWKTPLSIGMDSNNQLQSKLHKLLTVKDDGSPTKGFFGVSAYGHSPTIDLDRQQVYVATSQTETAPEAAEKCEKYRRNQLGIRPDLYGSVGSIANPDNDPRFIAAGVTCSTLNAKLKTYGNAVVAMDLNTGKVNWAFYARPYDAWHHTCTPPVVAGFSPTLPFVLPIPLSNAANCFQDPIGPDYGFGSNPMLLTNVKMPNYSKRDMLIAGNKDGNVFALDPNTGKQIWKKSIDPGGLYGGIQFGMASDGTSIFVGTANSINNNRDRRQAFQSSEDFMILNGLGNLTPPLRYGLHEKLGATTDLHDVPGPSATSLPFLTPFSLFGPASGYPDTGLMYQGTGSGPLELHTVINMPVDVPLDGINVWQEGNKIKTIAGMVHSVDAATGKIQWQRPAVDGIAGYILPSEVYGSVTISNGIVFAGYSDNVGTLVGLNAQNGKKVFEYHNQITYPDPHNLPNTMTVNIGDNEAGPSIVDGTLYWGMGAFTLSGFPRLSNALPWLNMDDFLVYPSGGNSVIAFELNK